MIDHAFQLLDAIDRVRAVHLALTDLARPDDLSEETLLALDGAMDLLALDRSTVAARPSEFNGQVPA